MNIKYLTTGLLNIFLGLVEGFLAIRFILKLFGANAANGFVSWIYEMSGALLDPFREIFPTKVFQSTFVIEFSTIFAMVVYAIIAVLVVALLDVVMSPGKTSSK